jgi:hypothetical protein
MCHDVGVMSFLTPMALPFLSIRAAKGLPQAVALSVLAASGVILANPGSAEAAACNTTPGALTSYSIADLQPIGTAFSCDIGDKTYSNFIFNGLTTGAYTFTVDPTTYDHIFSGSGLNFTGSGFTYEYKVSLNSSAPTGQAFKSYNTGYAGSSTTNASYKFKKVLEAYTTGGALISGGTLAGIPANAKVTAENAIATVPGIGLINGIVTDGPYTFAGGETGPIVFKNTVTRPTAGGRIDVITDSVTQLVNNTPPPKAPAPLPILGAGAAFGLSRKLRRRIKLA